MLPTPVFFYGMEPGEEISVEIERGKTLIIKFLTVGEPHADGTRTVFFELNGQPREVSVLDRSLQPSRHKHPKADPDNPKHVGAPHARHGRAPSRSKRRHGEEAGQKLLSSKP